MSFSRVGKHESVAVWGLTPAAASSQQHEDGTGVGSTGGSGRGDLEANPTGLGQQQGQRSMLERLNDGDEDDASDSTQSSGEDNDLEITCKLGGIDSSRRLSHVGDIYTRVYRRKAPRWGDADGLACTFCWDASHAVECGSMVLSHESGVGIDSRIMYPLGSMGMICHPWEISLSLVSWLLSLGRGLLLPYRVLNLSVFPLTRRQ